MTLPITSQPNIRSGLCPHGLPPALCPICNKQASGSMSNSPMTKTNKHQGEWSYQKCYVQGLQIKAAMQRHEDNKTFLEKQFNNSLFNAQNVQKILNNIENFIQNIKQPNIQFMTQTLLNNIVTPLLNIVSSLSKFSEKLINLEQKFTNMLFQAGEKIAAVFGEIKNFINRNIVDKFKQKAKKILLFFLSFAEDENYKNDETLAIFKSRELKKFVVKILKKRNEK